MQPFTVVENVISGSSNTGEGERPNPAERRAYGVLIGRGAKRSWPRRFSEPFRSPFGLVPQPVGCANEIAGRRQTAGSPGTNDANRKLCSVLFETVASQ